MKKKTIIFMVFLLISSFFVGAVGMAVQHYLLIPLGIGRSEHPIALPFVLLADEILQAQVEVGLEALRNPPTEPPVTEPEITETVPPTTELPTQAPSEPPAQTVTEAPEEPSTEPPTEAPTEAPTEPVPVDESWFDDALFIGESRVQGLKLYGRLGTADYFSAASMTVFGILDAKLSDETFSSSTLEQLLTDRDYGKIYIHLGVNELPVGSEAIYDGYMKLIQRIRELEPDAKIMLMGIMALTEGYCNGSNFKIETIHTLNDMLKTLAESEPEIYRYVDTNAWAADENGYLKKEITFDGCHLYGSGYEAWSKLLMEEAGSYNIP